MTTDDAGTNERAPDGDRSYAAVVDRWDMPLAEAMQTQRAVRRVLADPVDDAIIVRCVELALRAPTGSNGQNWEFVVIKDPAVKAAFADQYRTAWSGYGGGTLDPRIADAVTWQVDHFEEIPVMVLACLADDGRGAPGPVDPPVRHSADRRDSPSGACLFGGRVTDPPVEHGCSDNPALGSAGNVWESGSAIRVLVSLMAIGTGAIVAG